MRCARSRTRGCTHARPLRPVVELTCETEAKLHTHVVLAETSGARSSPTTWRTVWMTATGGAKPAAAAAPASAVVVVLPGVVDTPSSSSPPAAAEIMLLLLLLLLHCCVLTCREEKVVLVQNGGVGVAVHLAHVAVLPARVRSLVSVGHGEIQRVCSRFVTIPTTTTTTTTTTNNGHPSELRHGGMRNVCIVDAQTLSVSHSHARTGTQTRARQRGQHGV